MSEPSPEAEALIWSLQGHQFEAERRINALLTQVALDAAYQRGLGQGRKEEREQAVRIARAHSLPVPGREPYQTPCYFAQGHECSEAIANRIECGWDDATTPSEDPKPEEGQ